MTQAGPAIPVIASNQPPDGGPALRVAVVSDGRPTEAGPARPMIEVFDNRPTQGNEPVPIVVSRGNGFTLAGPPQPVRVVSGYLGSAYGAKIAALGPIQYLPMDEPSGSVAFDRSGNGRNGAYTGVALGQPGIGDGRTAAAFDGATSYCNMYSPSLALAFSGAAGSQIIWCKVGAPGVWTDGVTRRAMYMLVDASNRAGLFKPTTSNEIDCLYVAGGTALGAAKTAFSPTIWFHLGLTWNKVADQMIFYVNGAAITPISTGLGTFAGSLSSTQTLIGSLSTAAAQVWNGLMAHAAVFNRALSASEVLSAATL
jgi:Concanavalin A-like lectin/glucanases superfamily